MPKPTKEQLERINRFTLTPLTEENCFVFKDLMIDNQPTSYSSRIHIDLLRKFVQDANKGVGLLMNHNQRSLPVGRSFGAELVEDYNSETGEYIPTVYGEFYIDLGRNTEGNMTTDDIAKGIEAGTLFDTSIGFNSETWDCSICNHDIRDYSNCYHLPGEKYEVKGDDDVYRTETCYVIVGRGGVGELLENSLVFSGACDRASIQNYYSSNSVKENDNGTKLHLVDNFKNIPVGSTIYQYYTEDGSVLFTDTNERTNGLEELKKRSDEKVEFAKFKEVLDKFSIKADTPEELTEAIEGMQSLSKDLEATKEELTTAQKELQAKETEVETLSTTLAEKEEAIEELKATNEELTKKADLADVYRKDLTAKALELGVRAQGNAFNKDMYEKFLGTLSVEEVKEVIEGFEKEVEARFSGVRLSAPKGQKVQKRAGENAELTRDDFETEQEYRDHVAEEAMKLAKKEGIEYKEAVKQVFAKYESEDGGAE